jgi:hypothetical protein
MSARSSSSTSVGAEAFGCVVRLVIVRERYSEQYCYVGYGNLITERVLERKSAGRKARLSSVQLIQAATKLLSAIG